MGDDEEWCACGEWESDVSRVLHDKNDPGTINLRYNVHNIKNKQGFKWQHEGKLKSLPAVLCLPLRLHLLSTNHTLVSLST